MFFVQLHKREFAEVVRFCPANSLKLGEVMAVTILKYLNTKLNYFPARIFGLFCYEVDEGFF